MTGMVITNLEQRLWLVVEMLEQASRELRVVVDTVQKEVNDDRPAEP